MKRNALVFSAVVVTVAAMIYTGAYKSRMSSVQALDKESLSGQIVGKQAPDFELETLDGKKVKLSDYKGKAVLLNFWATWCGPCKIEMPWFVQFEKDYRDQGFEIVGVAMDDSKKEAIADFAKEMGVNYTILRGKESVGELYGGVMGLPTSFYIGRDGKIVGEHQGLNSRSDIEDKIKAALAQGGQTPKQNAVNQASDPAQSRKVK